jgi:hypothetical protein
MICRACSRLGRRYWDALQLSYWLSQLLSQNFLLFEHEPRQVSHWRLHSSQPVLVLQLEHPGQLKSQSVPARSQLL